MVHYRPVFVILLSLLALNGHAESPIQWSAPKGQTKWDRKSKVVELFNGAIVRQPGETLTADYVRLDLENKKFVAKGNVVYVLAPAGSQPTTLAGEELDFDFDSKLGTLKQGRVSVSSSFSRFSVTGSKIEKIGQGHFLIKDGDFTTCVDCPSSWTISGTEIDAEFEEYAFVKNAMVKVNGVPIAWIPYFVFPLKQKRQTGLLAPQFDFNATYGFLFTLPFFWAASPYADVTLYPSYHTKRGYLVATEAKYKINPLSGIAVRTNAFHDPEYLEYGSLVPQTKNRWSLQIEQSQDIPWSIFEKFRFIDVTDLMLTNIDRLRWVPTSGPVTLESDLMFSKSTETWTSSIQFQRHRNLLFPDIRGFDPRTLQVLPRFFAGTFERRLLGPEGLGRTRLFGGLSLDAWNFTRGSTFFDCDYYSIARYNYNSNPANAASPLEGSVCNPNDPNPTYVKGVHPLRKATRFLLNPRIFTTLRPLNRFEIIPSVQYKGLFYNFPSESDVKPLFRGYVQGQTEVSTEFEKTYSFEPSDPDDGIPYTPDELANNTFHIKHLIRPRINYSIIPIDHTNKTHPFITQSEINYSQAAQLAAYRPIAQSYVFDSYDTVPIDGTEDPASSTNYFEPLGNAISYGLSTFFIRVDGPIKNRVITAPGAFLQATVGQSFNLRALKYKNLPFATRLNGTLSYGYGPWSYGANYFYYPFRPGTDESSPENQNMFGEPLSRHVYTLNLSYNFGTTGFGIRSTKLEYIRGDIPRLALTKGTSTLVPSTSFGITDWLVGSGSASYNFFDTYLSFDPVTKTGEKIPPHFNSWNVGLSYISVSDCWQAGVSISDEYNKDMTWSPSFSVNFTGGSGGFESITQKAGSTFFR